MKNSLYFQPSLIKSITMSVALQSGQCQVKTYLYFLQARKRLSDIKSSELENYLGLQAIRDSYFVIAICSKQFQFHKPNIIKN